MATIIDSLIVELRLDPTGFNEGQRRAVGSLREMERQTSDSARRVDATTNKSVRGYLAGFEEQFKSIDQRLERMGANSRRTGDQIRRSSDDASTGLKGLQSAALAAYGSLKGIEGVIGQLTSSADRGAALGRIATLTNMDAKAMDAFALAVQRLSNVPLDTTLSALNEYQQKLTGFKERNENSEFFTPLGQLGVDFQASLPEQMRQLHKIVQGKDGAAAQFWMGKLSLGPLTTAMRDPRLDSEVARAGPRSLNDDQIKSLTELQKAAIGVQQAYQSLWEKVTADFSKSGLAKALEGLDEFLTSVSNNKEQLKSIETVLEGIGILLGVTLVSALGKLTIAVNSFWALPLFRFLVANPAVAGFIAAATVMSPSETNKGEADAVKGGLHAPGTSEYEDAQRKAALRNKQTDNSLVGRFKRWWYGEGQEATTDIPGAGVAGGGGGFATGTLGALQRAIYEEESKSGKNYNNAPIPGHSASGPMQMMPGTFTENARPGEKYDNPADNLRVGQRLVATLYERYGGDIDKAAYAYANGSITAPDRNPGYTARIRALMMKHPQWMAGGRAAAGANPDIARVRDDPTTPFPTRTNGRGRAGAFDPSQQHWYSGPPVPSINQIRNPLKDIDTHPATTHNYGDLNTGDIHIHTNADSATGIAGEIGGALKAKVLVNSANTGLE